MNEDDSYNKAIFQYRSAVAKLLMPLRVYGQGDLVDGATESLVSMAVQLHHRILGVTDDPYYYEPVGDGSDKL